MWRPSSVPKRHLHTTLCLVKKINPHNLKGKSASEQRWLARQLSDPFVKASHVHNYRCRSAFKLLEIDEQFKILRPGYSVLDCGAAPGAWSQIAAQKVNSAETNPKLPCGAVVGVDLLLHIAPLDGVHFLSDHDITDPVTHAKLMELLPNGQAHVILSDMAPNASGFRELDHEKLIYMCLSLIDLAEKILRPGGSLVCKYWDGALAHTLRDKLCCVFSSVRTLKPKASRKESAELYFLARMYKTQIK